MRQIITLLLLCLTVQLIQGQKVDYVDNTKDWFQISQECNSNKQSPINFDLNLVEQAPVCNSRVEFEVEFKNEKILTYNHDNQLSIQLNGEWSTLRFKNEHGERLEYKAYQINTHLDSEHTFNEQKRPLEMHIVYQLIEEDHHKTFLQTAILGITFQISREVPRSPFLDQWNFNAETYEKSVEINLHKELNEQVNRMGQSVYFYEGSYTTPPCAENVQWFVLADPVIVTTSHFNNLMTFIALHYKTMPNTNARPVQPINDRSINKIFTTCPKDTLVNDVMKGGDFSYLLLLYCLIGFFIFFFSLFADIRNLKGTDAFALGNEGVHVHFGIFDFILCHPAFICLHYNPKSCRTFRSLSFICQIAFLFGVAANLNFWRTFLICIGAKPFFLFFRRVFSYENKYRYAAFLFYAGVITISVGACVYGVYVRSYFDEWGLSILYAWIIDFCGIDVLFLIFDVLFFHLWTRNKSPTLERWCDIEELFEYYTWKEHFHHHHGDNQYKQVHGEGHDHPHDDHDHQHDDKDHPHHPIDIPNQNQNILQQQQQQQQQQTYQPHQSNIQQNQNGSYMNQYQNASQNQNPSQVNQNQNPSHINQNQQYQQSNIIQNQNIVLDQQHNSQIKPPQQQSQIQKHLDTYEVDADEAGEEDDKPKMGNYESKVIPGSKVNNQ